MPRRRILAQDVGQPDPVIYRRNAATTFEKHLVDVSLQVWDDVWKGDGEADGKGCGRGDDEVLSRR